MDTESFLRVSFPKYFPKYFPIVFLNIYVGHMTYTIFSGLPPFLSLSLLFTRTDKFSVNQFEAKSITIPESLADAEMRQWSAVIRPLSFLLSFLSFFPPAQFRFFSAVNPSQFSTQFLTQLFLIFLSFLIIPGLPVILLFLTEMGVQRSLQVMRMLQIQKHPATARNI